MKNKRGAGQEMRNSTYTCITVYFKTRIQIKL